MQVYEYFQEKSGDDFVYLRQEMRRAKPGAEFYSMELCMTDLLKLIN